jgi:hypothetical protein
MQEKCLFMAALLTMWIICGMFLVSVGKKQVELWEKQNPVSISQYYL